MGGRELKRSDRAEARAEPLDDAEARGSGNAAGPLFRGNPLVGALMKALQGLQSGAMASTSSPAVGVQPDAGVGAQGVAPADSPDSPGTPGPSGLSAGDLKEAAYAFANELFSALRNVAQPRDDEGHGRHHGHGHGHHGHTHTGWGRGGRREDDPGRFGGLVDRLQALAGRIASPQPAESTAAANTDTAAAAGSATPPATPAAQPTPPSAAATVPTTPSTMAVQVTAIGIQVDIQVRFDLGAPAQDQGSPLLAAFQQLMDKLSPSPQGSANDTENAASRLKTFLLDMASALTAGGQRGTVVQAPVGGLVNLTA